MLHVCIVWYPMCTLYGRGRGREWEGVGERGEERRGEGEGEERRGVCHVRYRTFKYNIICWLTILYVNLVIVCWLQHRTLIYDVVCYTYDIICLFWRHFQLTSNFQKTPSQGMHIWPAYLLHLAPLFRPCKQCWQVRNTVIFYIKNGYCHAPIGWRLDQWTVQTPSLGVRAPHCTIPGAVGWFCPDIHGAWVEELTSAMVQTSGFLPTYDIVCRTYDIV